MNAVIKSLIGLGALGSVGGGIYGITLQLSSERKDINKRLKSEGYQVLENDSAEWNNILTNYEAKVKKNDKLKFRDFTGEDREKITQLKEECKKSLEKEADDEGYQKAKHWCTAPRTLKELLKKSGYSALSTNTDDDSQDKEKWDIKLDDHVKNEARFTGKKFSGDEKIKSSNSASKEKENRDAIKIKCKELENKKHYEVDFEKNLEMSQLWCSIKINES